MRLAKLYQLRCALGRASCDQQRQLEAWLRTPSALSAGHHQQASFFFLAILCVRAPLINVFFFLLWLIFALKFADYGHLPSSSHTSGRRRARRPLKYAARGVYA